MRRRDGAGVLLVVLVGVALWWGWTREPAPLTAPAVAPSDAPPAAASRVPGRAWGDAAWRGRAQEDPGRVRVSCRLPEGMGSEGLRVRAWHLEPGTPDAPGDRGSFTVLVGGDVAGVRAGAKIVSRGDGVITLAFPRPDGPLWVGGSLESPGAGRAVLDVRLTPDGGTCTIGGFRGYAFVSGRVTGTTASDVQVFGCGGHATADGSGSFYMEVAPAPCELVAVRQDGAFTVRSAPVPVDPASGADITLDLSLPSFRAAGVGAQVQEQDGGIRLLHVFPGTPAAEAGLVDGDLVVGLDGEDVSGLDAEDFIALALGREGTPVTYVVVRDGAPVEVTMTRRVMENPRPR